MCQGLKIKRRKIKAKDPSRPRQRELGNTTGGLPVLVAEARDPNESAGKENKAKKKKKEKKARLGEKPLRELTTTNLQAAEQQGGGGGGCDDEDDGRFECTLDELLGGGVPCNDPAAVDDAPTPKKRKGKVLASKDKKQKENKPLLTEAEMAKYMKNWEGGGALRQPYIREMDIYSACPVKLFKSLQYAPRATKLGGEETHLVRSRVPANSGRRVRIVAGEEDGLWHEEAGPKPILDTDGKSALVFMTTFSYMVRTTTDDTRRRTGWKMVEYTLSKIPAAGQWLLCLFYESNRTRHHAEQAPPIKQLTRCDEEDGDELLCPGGAEVAVDGEKAAATTASGLITLIVSMNDKLTTFLREAARKALVWDFQNVCEIPEFVCTKERCHRAVDDLGLDRSLISRSLEEVEVHLKYIAATKSPIPAVQDNLVSLGTRLCATILSAYSNESEKKEPDHVLGRTGVNAQQDSQMALEVMNAHDSVARSAVFENGFVSEVEGADGEPSTRVNSGDRFPVGAPQGANCTTPVSVPEGGDPAWFLNLLELDLANSSYQLPVGDSDGLPDMQFEWTTGFVAGEFHESNGWHDVDSTTVGLGPSETTAAQASQTCLDLHQAP